MSYRAGMTQDIYDDEGLFPRFSRLPRSIEGLG